MGSKPQSMASFTPSSTTPPSQTTTIVTPTQSHSPLLLLSNMSKLMSIKLNYTNYIPWKHQLITILEAYSLIEHIDGLSAQPCQCLLDAQGSLTTNVNLDFLTWRIKDKALLSLINSTLTPQVFSLVVGMTTSREVWNTLKQRSTSTSRENILNLKLELQSLKKGSDSINGFLQKIKIAQDKLLPVGVIVDNEELICIVLHGWPKEFPHFCSTICAKSDPITYEHLSIILQSEEQAMAENSNNFSHSLVMYASGNKHSNNSQFQSQNNGGSNQGRGKNNNNIG